jgi:hypothetical protein
MKQHRLCAACLRAGRLRARGSTLYSPSSSCLTVVGIYSASTQHTGSEIFSKKFATSRKIMHIHCVLVFCLFPFGLLQTGNDVEPEYFEWSRFPGKSFVRAPHWTRSCSLKNGVHWYCTLCIKLAKCKHCGNVMFVCPNVTCPKLLGRVKKKYYRSV